MAVRRVLILGGYGNFGKRIAENLSDLKDITVIITGRSAKKAEQLCQALSSSGKVAKLQSAVIDIYKPEFLDELKLLAPDLVIHTGGPFQAQDYRVPEACIEIGSHYIDLADDRRFVCDITTLNDRALKRGVLIVSGASSVPGLSSTVIDSFANKFSTINSLDLAIAPGNQADRGEATVRGILSYTGRPFPVFCDGEWIDQYGWMSSRKLNFGDVIGERWLANVDIPDLELFPKRYKPVATVRFQAGLELPLLHHGMVFMAKLAKLRLVKDWSVYTRLIFKASDFLKRLGTGTGGMQINISGLDENKKVKRIKWTLCAENNVGPFIPTISAIILAKKLIADTIETQGATPCLGLYTVKEFDKEAMPLGIHHKTEHEVG